MSCPLIIHRFRRHIYAMGILTLQICTISVSLCICSRIDGIVEHSCILIHSIINAADCNSTAYPQTGTCASTGRVTALRSVRFQRSKEIRQCFRIRKGNFDRLHGFLVCCAIIVIAIDISHQICNIQSVAVLIEDLTSRSC